MMVLYFSDASLCTCNGIAQCVGGSTQKLLSRSALFTSPGDQNKLLVAAGDESAKAVSKRGFVLVHLSLKTFSKWPISELPFASVSKRVLVRSLSYGN